MALALLVIAVEEVAAKAEAVVTLGSTAIASLAHCLMQLTLAAESVATAAMVPGLALVGAVDAGATAETPIFIAPILAYGPAPAAQEAHPAPPRQLRAEWPAPLEAPGKL